jgi:hypothetical protein
MKPHARREHPLRLLPQLLELPLDHQLSGIPPVRPGGAATFFKPVQFEPETIKAGELG